MRQLCAVFLPGLVALLAACGGTAPAQSVSSSARANTIASSSPAGGLEAVRQGASKEGHVVVASTLPPSAVQDLSNGFRQAYGVNLDFLPLNPAELNARVDREAKAGKPSLDIAIGGFSGCWTMAGRGQIDDIQPLIVDPALRDPNVWTGGSLNFLKPSPQLPQDFHCSLLTTSWVMTDLFVDKDVVKPDSIHSWKDLLKPEFKGKIASYDPRQPGPAQTTVPYLDRLFGDDYLKQLYVDQKVTPTNDNRQLAEWVARGAYPIGIALVQNAIEPLRTEGLPLERVFPVDGPGPLTPGFGSIMRIKGGPDPSAATLFINWFAGRDAQEIWEKDMMEVSLRSDITHKVPDYILPKSGVSYTINAADPDQYFNYGLPVMKKLQDLLGR